MIINNIFAWLFGPHRHNQGKPFIRPRSQRQRRKLARRRGKPLPR